MSGPKEADVQLQVNKAIEVIERQVRESGATRNLYASLGVNEAESSRNVAQNAAAPSWSEQARKHAGGEMRSAQAVADDIASAIREGDRHFSAAEKLKRQADQKHQESQNKLNQANKLCRDATGGLSTVQPEIAG